MGSKIKFRPQAVIPLVTAALALVFIIVGLKDFGFWTNQPTPGFFPIIIAVALLLTSVICFLQMLRENGAAVVKYNVNELLVILGAAGIIAGTFLIGLLPSCLLYIFLWLKVVERAPWKAVIVIELIIAAIILGVFTAWLQVRFPVGLLGDLLGL